MEEVSKVVGSKCIEWFVGEEDFIGNTGLDSQPVKLHEDGGDLLSGPRAY